jgi:type II secretory pathway predicted ATPase ExeA
MELKDGMRRLLGVCLVGQPELDHLLGANQRDIREIVQRCERVTLEPLGGELAAYLAHKFERVGADIKTVLAPDAYAAIAKRLSYVPRGGKAQDEVSICYPLVVNNLVCRAMNSAAKVSWPLVDAQAIAGC